MSVNTSLQSIERQTNVILDHLKGYGSLRALMITDMTSGEKNFEVDEQPVWMTLVYYLRDFILANISNLNLHIFYSWDPKKEIREAIGDEFSKINDVAQRVLAEPEFTEDQESTLKGIKQNLEDIEPYLTGNKYFDDDYLWPMIDWYIGYTPASQELQSSLDHSVRLINESLRKFDEVRSVCPEIQRVVRGHLARREAQQRRKEVLLEDVKAIVDDESSKPVPRQPRCIDSVFRYLSKKMSETTRIQTFDAVVELIDKVSLQIKDFPARRDPSEDIKRKVAQLIEEGFPSWLALKRKNNEMNAFGEIQSIYEYYSLIMKNFPEQKETWEQLLNQELNKLLLNQPFRDRTFDEEDYEKFGAAVIRFYGGFPESQFHEKVGQAYQKLINCFGVEGKAAIQKAGELNSLAEACDWLNSTLPNFALIPGLTDANASSIEQFLKGSKESFVKKICSFDFVDENKLKLLIDSLGLEDQESFLLSWHSIKEFNSRDIYKLQEVSDSLGDILDNFETLDEPDRLGEEKLMLLRAQTILLTDIADKLEWVQMPDGDFVQVNLAIREHFNSVCTIRQLLTDIPATLGDDPIKLDLEIEADLERDRAMAEQLQNQGDDPYPFN